MLLDFNQSQSLTFSLILSIAVTEQSPSGRVLDRSEGLSDCSRQTPIRYDV